MKKTKLIASGLLSLTVALSTVAFSSQAFAQTTDTTVNGNAAAAPAPPNAGVENPAVELNGDILVDGDTEANALHETEAGAEIKYESTLDVKSIKDTLTAVENSNLLPAQVKNNLGKIVLYDTASSFVATLTVRDDQVDLTNVKATLSENNLFKLQDQNGVEVETFELLDANKQAVKYTSLKVNMVLKKTYESYVALKDDVLAAPDIIEVKTTGAKVKDTVKPGDKIKAEGYVYGEFKSTANLFGIEMPFNFNWEGVQLPEGKDFDNKDDDDTPEEMITFTSIVKASADADDDMPADMPMDPEKKPEMKPAKKMSKSPKTSDNFAAGAVFGTLIVSAAGVLTLRRKNRG